MSKKYFQTIYKPYSNLCYFFRVEGVEGEVDTYDVRVYKVEDLWNIEITVDQDGEVKVERILDDDEEVDDEEPESKKVLLEQIDLKRFKVQSEGGQLRTIEIKDGLQMTNTVVGIANGLTSIVTACLPLQ